MRKVVKDTGYYREKFVAKANARHGGRYDYSKVVYANSLEKVEVICPEHGSFFVRPDAHIRKVGCPRCNGGGRDTREDFVAKAEFKHGCRYSYSKAVYVNSGTKVEVVCLVPGHGAFAITPRNHLAGQGCPKCAGVYRRTGEEFLRECAAVHGDEFDYSLVEYAGTGSKIRIVCPDHGEFSQAARDHLAGHGCPVCSSSKGEKMVAGVLESLGVAFERGRCFEGCRGVQGGQLPFDFYLPSEKMVVEFDGRQHFEPVEAFGGEAAFARQAENDEVRNGWCAANGIRIVRVRHDRVGECLERLYAELAGPAVAVSAIRPSEFSLGTFLSLKQEMVSYVCSLGGEAGTEIGGWKSDACVASSRLAFRMLGHWRDGEVRTGSRAASAAQAAYEAAGWKLIGVYEDAWRDKKEIVKSRMNNLLGRSEKVWARKCDIGPVTASQAREFLDSAHIQGSVGSSHKIGLYLKGRLVALMTFGPLRKNLGQKGRDRSWELLRYCTARGLNVVGGASRLFASFLKEKDPEYVVSYADKCWSTKDNIYGSLGMRYARESKPSYFYIVGNSRKGRFGYRKDVLVSMGFDAGMTEREICARAGLRRIYDCGTIKYEYRKV